MLDQQYQLVLQDMQAGRYEVARQRLEYVLTQNPAYPGATDKLVEILAVLYATATPLPVTPTPLSTATPDLRPAQEQFNQAQSLLAGNQWSPAIDLILSLRQQNAAFQSTRLDGWLYLALRQRGVDKILNQGDLEGGLYDLTLAENFGLLDGEAEIARQWARLYMIGSSFWEAYPEQAVYYFSQVAAAAPGLRDASGWTAMERYRAALVQYGEALAKQEDWCGAQGQYELALAIHGGDNLAELASAASEQCNPSTQTPEATATPSLTPTLSPTTWLETPVSTFTSTPSPTEDISLPGATSTTPAPQPETPTPTSTPPPVSEPTATPTSEPPAPTPLTPTTGASTNP